MLLVASTYEVTRRPEHDSSYAAITEQKDTTVETYCNQYCDLLHVTWTDLETPVARITNEGATDFVYKNGGRPHHKGMPA